MKPRILIPLFLSVLLVSGRAQFLSPGKTQGQIPVDITSDSGTSMEAGVLVANNNVVLYYGDVTIYCDHAEYNPETHEALVRGNVRIYQSSNPGTPKQKNLLTVTDRALYNLDTKQLRTASFGANRQPFEIEGEALYSPGTPDVYNIVNGSISTSDSSKPDYQLKAKHIRLYPNDRIILSNVTMYVGQIPVMWFPYLYQSLNNQFSYNIVPGENGTFGAYLLTAFTFPLTNHLEATTHLDFRSSRGPAIGLDLDYTKKDVSGSYAKLSAYFLNDQQADLNNTSLGRENISNGRYRVTFRSHYFLTDDLTVLANIDKLSDPYMMQDFYPFQFSYDPAPDNFVELEKKGEAYTLSALFRFQANNFDETVERLPDVSWNVARTPLFNSGIFYEQNTSAALLHRAFITSSLGDTPLNATQFNALLANGFPNGSLNTLNGGFNPFNPNLQEFRLDSFHQFTFPKTYFGWLSIVPRAGVRGTYYSQTGKFTAGSVGTSTENFYEPGSVTLNGPRFRLAFNAGVEASFKVQRTWENVQSRWLGLEGLRHIIQPYTDFSWVSSPTVKPGDLLPMDALIPNTTIAPIDFPQFNASDSISDWTIWRIGMRNRLQTRRGDQTFNWLDIDTYFDVNFHSPFDTHQFSELVNQVRFSPVPWLGVGIFAQLPAFDTNGFTEFNTYLDWIITPKFEVALSDLILQHDAAAGFPNSNAITVNAYYKLNENWGFSVFEQYEAAQGVLQEQQYWVHRDLSSWIGSVGIIARDNGGGRRDIGVEFMFTLKDLPQRSLKSEVNQSSSD